ncbi:MULTISPECIES: alpha/beta hydrolase [unclassified Enterococcus]|uniref:alpha/beta hydrolase n=1 Tax=unclassified Enterococcus TaxID=2608891 RepID=UPI0028FD0C4B|nr:MULTISPECIES: alpha/beta fold hydrolase [unclassified Enterococcus]MDU0320667.1 alpha/beta hydrolase [Enterococcus sp. 2STP]MDU0350397.1 alpha/beta hydrolase [Enterococcus sp. 3MOLP]
MCKKIKQPIIIIVLGLIFFLGSQKVVQADTIYSKNEIQEISTVMKSVQEVIKEEGFSKLKEKYNITANKYSSQNDYLNKVENFYKQYDPNNGLFLFLLEVTLQKICDKYENPDQVNTIDQAWNAYLFYDTGFLRDSLLFQMLSMNVPPEPSLPKREIKVIDQSTGENLNLNAYYLDQNSDTTIVTTGGFRSNGWDMSSPEIQMLVSFGYNVLFTEPRSAGISDGKYITLGYYEKDDFAAWVKNEISLKPNQNIYYYGGSMGGATVMGALNNEIPSNVKGMIEVAGYTSVDGELTHVYNLAAEKLGVTLSNMMGLTEENRQATFDLLDTQLLQPNIHMTLYSNLPLSGVQSSAIPKLFLHGDADNIVPLSNAQSLYGQAIGSQNTLKIIPGGTHEGNIFIGDLGIETHQAIERFFNSLSVN